jgi:hypothetical protein
MLSALWMAVMLQALPPCELPDLAQPSNAWSTDFRELSLPDGAIGVAMPDPMAEDGERLSGIPADPVPPLADSSSTRWLWSEASDWLLVPVGFKVSVAVVGVDGSWIIEMQDPEHSDRRLRAHGTGACVGCAYSAGAVYFDSYAQQARDNEFEFCRGTTQAIVRDAVGAARLRYHYDNPSGLRHDAVAIIGVDEVNFSELVLSGLDEPLRLQILDAFKP